MAPQLQPEFVTVHGIIIPGYRVASQKSREYPYGTIDKQKPFFKALGLDLDGFFSGTLNISISPFTFRMIKPQYTFRQVEWTDLHPPEDFSFSACKVIFKDEVYEGFVYYPHPETKKRHFEGASLIEVLCRHIPGLNYHDPIDLQVRAAEIEIEPPR